MIDPASTPMNSDTKPEIVEVRQAAAELAELLMGWTNIDGNDVAAIRNGVWDDDDTDLGMLVQFVRKHRIFAIREAERVERERVLEEAAKVARTAEGLARPDYWTGRADAADAIRALKDQPHAG